MKKPTVIVVCLALLLGIGITAAACGQSSGASTPKQAAEDLLNRMKSGDWESVYKDLSASGKKEVTLEQFTDYGKQSTAPSDLKWTVTGTKTSGDKANVTVKLQAEGQTDVMSFTFVKEGGGWKFTGDMSSPESH